MLKVAIVGAGNMARCHMDVAAHLNDVEIVGIFSRSRERAVTLAKEYGVKIVANSINELFSNAKPDGVIIAVSETSTEKVLTEAFLYPWKILVEKPVGLGLSSTRRLCRLSTDKGIDVFVAMNRRHYSSTRTIINHLQKSDVARVVEIHDQEDPSSALAMGRDKLVCDQWHFANSIHLTDLFHVFCRGEIADILNVVPWFAGYEAKITHSVIKFGSGDVGIYHSIWNGPGPWSVSINIGEKRFEMRPLEQLLTQTFPSRQLDEALLDDCDIIFKPGFLKQMESFVDTLNGDATELPRLCDYLRSVELTNALYSSL